MAEPSVPIFASDPATGDAAVRRLWQQPLGDIHHKLGNIVGAGSLSLNFDCSDQDFVFALTSRWPLNADFTHSLYETDTLKLADAMNGLARLYAIETGVDHLHVLLEARRGKFEVPGFWQANGHAPVLFATYAFDTSFAQVGLFSDLNDAYAEMELLSQPHRLLVAIGPAAPQLVDADGGELLLDADEERLQALRRWNQKLSLQINRLLADTVEGDFTEMSNLVEALSKVRDLSARLAVQLIERESRMRRRAAKPGDALTDELYSVRPRSGRPGPQTVPQTGLQTGIETSTPDIHASHETRLAETLSGLQTALQSESLKEALTPGVRAELQKSLAALTPPPAKPAVQQKPGQKSVQKQSQNPAQTPPRKPERRAAPVAKAVAPKAGPSAAMVLLALLAVSGLAQARDKGDFGFAPYRDTMRYYEYADNRDARLASGGNGTVTPGIAAGTAKWDESKDTCASRVAHSAHRRYGNVPIEVYSDGTEGAAMIDGKRYTYQCSGDPVTGLIVFRPDKTH